MHHATSAPANAIRSQAAFIVPEIIDKGAYHRQGRAVLGYLSGLFEICMIS